MTLKIQSPPNVWGEKTQSTNTEDRGTSTQTLYAPNKKTVCKNIKHESQEYEG